MARGDGVTGRSSGARRFEQLVNGSRDAYLELDRLGRVTEWSAKAETLFGHVRADVVGRSLVDLVASAHAELVERGMKEVVSLSHAAADRRIPDVVELELALLGADGTPVLATGRVFAMGRDQALRIGGFFHPARAASPAEATDDEIVDFGRLQDTMTGLATRDQFARRLVAALSTLGGTASVAVAVVALDRFTAINEAFGHELGDRALAAVAERLRAAAPAAPFLGRLHDDQYVALFTAGSGSAVADAERFATRVHEALAPPIEVGNHEVLVSACTGICGTTDPTVRSSAVLSNACAALHEAQRTGPGTVRVFGERMRRELVERLSTETALHRALDRGQLALVYQPVVDLAYGTTVGVEALLRWDHPTLGAIEPARFVPLAEENGLIVPIGRWVIEEACAQLARWCDQPGVVPDTVQVNLSARQFDDPGLFEFIAHVLETTGLGPRRLVLEVTESALVRDTQAALGILRDVKALGVVLAIDDFGTGYSSLSYLQQFPFDVLKVDRSFVVATGGDEGAKIAAAVVNLAHELGLVVVAEGVETPEQAALARSLGCDCAQGYLYSPPMPPATLAGTFSVGKSVEKGT